MIDSDCSTLPINVMSDLPGRVAGKGIPPGNDDKGGNDTGGIPGIDIGVVNGGNVDKGFGKGMLPGGGKAENTYKIIQYNTHLKLCHLAYHCCILKN